MGDTITSKFIKAFGPTNESHVKWLQKMTSMAESLSDAQKHQHLVREIQANPMNVPVSEIEALDWPHIHFVLAMSYAKAVLTGRAYIPHSSSAFES
jgi:hypothetical protein